MHAPDDDDGSAHVHVHDREYYVIWKVHIHCARENARFLCYIGKGVRRNVAERRRWQLQRRWRWCRLYAMQITLLQRISVLYSLASYTYVCPTKFTTPRPSHLTVQVMYTFVEGMSGRLTCTKVHTYILYLHTHAHVMLKYTHDYGSPKRLCLCSLCACA